MRRLVVIVDQLPAWAFVATAILVLGAVRLAGSVAYLGRNSGGVELSRLLTLAAFLLLLIFAVRRRQTSVMHGALQVLVAVAGSSLLGIAAVWPLLPRHLPISLVNVLQADAGSQVTLILFGLPVATMLLWLSRRWGSHSPVTERRWRVVIQMMRERAERRRRPRVNATVAEGGGGGPRDANQSIS